MPIISRRNEKTGWKRTTGLYGHWPKHGQKGYLCIVTKTWGCNFWYGLRNPYRPGKIIDPYKIYPQR